MLRKVISKQLASIISVFIKYNSKYILFSLTSISILLSLLTLFSYHQNIKNYQKKIHISFDEELFPE